MTESKREQLIDRLQGFEHQAEIAIRDARRVRKALQAGKDEKAERECCGLEFAIRALNGLIRFLPKARILNKTCSQCQFFSSDCCTKAGFYSLVSRNDDACEYFSQRKGEKCE